MKKININILSFLNQDFDINIFIKPHLEIKEEESIFIAQLKDETGIFNKYEIEFEKKEGFEPFKVDPLKHHSIVAQYLYTQLVKNLPENLYVLKKHKGFNKRIYFPLKSHIKGKNCVWIEPFFYKSKSKWGIRIDYRFLSNIIEKNEKFKIDKDILIQSGTLNEKGFSNLDFYLFKHNYYQLFIQKILPIVNNIFNNNLSTDLMAIESYLLDSKTYIFGNNSLNASPYFGLSKNQPLESIKEKIIFYFIYKKEDRDIAVTLLKGLRGELSPTTFSGLDKLFKLSFNNDLIKGAAIDNFSNELIEKEISIIKSFNETVIPIIITNSKKDEEDDELYYRLKHKFTNEGMACQVVTKDLVKNEYSLKYSLSNIGLQIFAKAGGKPWKMKSATEDHLIIGIGQSYTKEKSPEGEIVEKNIAYSVLTDSSGLFKDIKVIGEGIEDDNYYNQLIVNISSIINNSGYNRITIHTPFRLSIDKVLKKVLKNIGGEFELNVVVINQKNDFFGFDYENNGLVPFESTFIKLSSLEYLVWFEGIQYSNPKITKRYGNPLLIKFWFTNREDNFRDNQFKNNLLQDCINLSGANWRGFKAKQLPVSVFYCQRIAEFISKFQEYNLPHIEIDNLKPWFL